MHLLNIGAGRISPSLGYNHSLKPDEILIEKDLHSFLVSQYTPQSITLNEANSIILQHKTLPASDLCESKKTF